MSEKTSKTLARRRVNLQFWLNIPHEETNTLEVRVRNMLVAEFGKSLDRNWAPHKVAIMEGDDQLVKP